VRAANNCDELLAPASRAKQLDHCSTGDSYSTGDTDLPFLSSREHNQEYFTSKAFIGAKAGKRSRRVVL
jgi:hypothetical protein